MSRRRGQVRRTRSSHEERDRIVYYCTGGAGTAAETALDGLTWLPGGGHVPVTSLEKPGPAILRCPLCGLSRPVGYKRRRAIRDAGITEADISRPPF
jgi:hypothetical protein